MMAALMLCCSSSVSWTASLVTSGTELPIELEWKHRNRNLNWNVEWECDHSPVEYPDDIQHELNTKVLPAFCWVVLY